MACFAVLIGDKMAAYFDRNDHLRVYILAIMTLYAIIRIGLVIPYGRFKAARRMTIAAIQACRGVLGCIRLITTMTRGTVSVIRGQGAVIERPIGASKAVKRMVAVAAIRARLGRRVVGGFGFDQVI